MPTLALLIPLIVQYGIPAAEAIWNTVQTWEKKGEVTPADWQALKDINARPLSFYEGPAVPAPALPAGTVLTVQ